MITDFLKNKIIPVALISALVGGLAGSAFTFTGPTDDTFQTSDVPTISASQTLDRIESTMENDTTAANQQVLSSNLDNPLTAGLTGNTLVNTRRISGAQATGNGADQTYYRQSRNTSRSSAKANTYDDYANHKATQPYVAPKRSFWQKHRDKLTVAAGTGAGAGLGAAIGGKKGALIGALIGGGGSAIYTYKVRKKNK